MSPARAAGDAALLLDAPGAAGVLAAAIGAAALPGILDIVPGAASVLVVTEPGRWDLAALERRIAALPLPGEAEVTAPEVEIPVRYDGADLAAVADLTGLSVSEITGRHQAPRYRVGWMGFSPGFGYLTGLDPVLAVVPRLATPRPSVPAGSVAIAGGLTAVYPAASPGGWHLLGHTQARLWDSRRQPPALLAPGTPVRFRAVPGPAARAAPAPPGPARAAAAPPEPAPPAAAGTDAPGGAGAARAAGWTGPVEVLRTGPLATIQDLGRPGYAHLGVPPAGAADPGSLRQANRLVGNADGAAGLEVTLGRLHLRFHAAAVVAVTGAPAAVSVTSGTGGPAPAPAASAVDVPAGAVLMLAAPADGLRSYLAIRGGIDIPPELGSRSADLLSGLGPRPLRPGDRLPVGAAGPAGPVPRRPGAGAGPAGWDQPAAHDHDHDGDRHRDRDDSGGDGGGGGGGGGENGSQDDDAVTLRVLAGPRDDWFDPAALRLLTGSGYQVTPASNRTGLRLSGPELARARPDELPSEGMVTGALQVPPDGQPILLLADHQTTGGYPVIAVVHGADIGRAAQLRPGRRVRFRLAASGPPSAPEPAAGPGRP